MATAHELQLLKEIERIYGSDAKQYFEKNPSDFNKLKTTLQDNLGSLDLQNTNKLNEATQKINKDVHELVNGVERMSENIARDIQKLAQFVQSPLFPAPTPTAPNPLKTRPDPFQR